jgi:hypothetical protein
MKKRAIWLYLGEEDAQVDLALYKVTFFYTDSHGDKVSIESDSDIFSAAKQFTNSGGLKVFANVQNRQEKPQASPPEAPTSRGSTVETSTQSTASVADLATQAACSSAAALLSARMTTTPEAGKVPKELQEIVTAVAAAAASAAVIAVWEHVQPSTNATKAQAFDYVPFIHGRRTRGTAPFVGARFNATKKQEGGDETFASMLQQRYQQQQQQQAPPRVAAALAPKIQAPAPRFKMSDGYVRTYVSVEEAIRRSLEGAKQVDAVTQTLETVVQKEEKATQSRACAESETTEETSCAEEQGGNSHEQESDDETTDSMPGLTPMGFKFFVPGVSPFKTAKETACEEGQAGVADDEELGETTDSMPGLTQVGFKFFVPGVSPFKTTKATACEEGQAGVAAEQESDVKSVDSMPGMIPGLPVKTAKETACEEGPIGVADEQESDDDISDSMPELATRAADDQESDDESADSMPGVLTRESKAFYAKASSAKSSVPKEVDIVSRGPELSFASDAEGSGEIAAVLGETLDRVAQAIDDLNLDLGRTPSGEQMEKEIDEDENSNIGQFTQDGDCDSWNMVADDDN